MSNFKTDKKLRQNDKIEDIWSRRKITGLFDWKIDNFSKKQ